MRVGQPVVFHQGSDEFPYSPLDTRYHPALVARVHEGGVLDLVVLPLDHRGEIVYRYKIPQRPSDGSGPHWE